MYAQIQSISQMKDLIFNFRGVNRPYDHTSAYNMIKKSKYAFWILSDTDKTIIMADNQ